MNVLSFFRDRRRRRAEALYAQACDLLDKEDYEAALAIARKLRKLRYSGAFDVEGRAYCGLDRPGDAVRVLREGVARVPGVARNWMLLGNALSDLGESGEALVAYDRAESLDPSNRATLELNRGVVAERRNDYAAMLRHLDDASGVEPRLYLRLIGCRVTALHGLGRDDEALDLATRVLDGWRNAGDDTGARDVGEMARVIIEIRLARGEDRYVLFEEAARWWRATKYEPLLPLLRDLRAQRSPDAQYFRLQIEGRIGPGAQRYGEVKGYITTADVVADSPEEALAFALELDPPGLGVAVTIDEAEILEPRPNDRKGVYRTMGRAYYEED